MTMAIQQLNQALSEVASDRREYRWENLLIAIEAIASGDALNWEAERVLLQVVRFEGELRLSEDSEPPHSMSPEEMLKSVAIQTLARCTGLTHLLAMQRVEATTASPVLASIVRATIRRATPPKLPASELEVISEIRPVPRNEVVIGPLGQNIGRRPLKALQRGRLKISENNADTLEHDTTYDVGWMPLTGADTTSGNLVFKGLRGIVSLPCKKKNVVNKAVFHEHGLTFFPSRRRRIKRAEEEFAFT